MLFLEASIRSEWWWWCWFGVWGLGEDVVVENCAREDGSLYRGQAWWLKRIYCEAMQKLMDTQKVFHLQKMFAGFMGEAFCESKVFLWSRPCVFQEQGPCSTNTEPWNVFHHSVAEQTDVSIGLGTPESAIGIFWWSHECWRSLRICSGSFCNRLSMRSKSLKPIKWPLSIGLHALQNSSSYPWLPSKRSNAKYCLYEHLHLQPQSTIWHITGELNHHLKSVLWQLLTTMFSPSGHRSEARSPRWVCSSHIQHLTVRVGSGFLLSMWL